MDRQRKGGEFRIFKQDMLRDKEIRTHYNQLAVEFALIHKLIETRVQRGMTQAALAKKIGTQQSAVSRFESGTYHPTLAFLEKIAAALGAELKVVVV